MHKSSNRKLCFESLENRRLAAGVNFQYTNLRTLHQQSTSQSAPAQQGSTTYGSSKSPTSFFMNHNETFIRAPRRGKR